MQELRSVRGSLAEVNILLPAGHSAAEEALGIFVVDKVIHMFIESSGRYGMLADLAAEAEVTLKGRLRTDLSA